MTGFADHQVPPRQTYLREVLQFARTQRMTGICLPRCTASTLARTISAPYATRSSDNTSIDVVKELSSWSRSRCRCWRNSRRTERRHRDEDGGSKLLSLLLDVALCAPTIANARREGLGVPFERNRSNGKQGRHSCRVRRGGRHKGSLNAATARAEGHAGPAVRRAGLQFL